MKSVNGPPSPKWEFPVGNSSESAKVNTPDLLVERIVKEVAMIGHVFIKQKKKFWTNLELKRIYNLVTDNLSKVFSNGHPIIILNLGSNLSLYKTVVLWQDYWQSADSQGNKQNCYLTPGSCKQGYSIAMGSFFPPRKTKKWRKCLSEIHTDVNSLIIEVSEQSTLDHCSAGAH